MSVKLLTEHHLECLSLIGGCRGSSESTLVEMPHCWKSHVTAHLFLILTVAEEEARDIKNKLQKELKQFWKDLGPVLQKQASLHDIARKDYEVKDLLIPEDLEDQDQKVSIVSSTETGVSS